MLTFTPCVVFSIDDNDDDDDDDDDGDDDDSGDDDDNDNDDDNSNAAADDDHDRDDDNDIERGSTRFFLSTHCATNCLQDTRSRCYGAIVHKLRTTLRVSLMCNISCAT